MASELNSVQDSFDQPFIPESMSSHDLAINNFSQVIFPDIPDFFPPDSDINVSYLLTEAIEASSRDWIGLFRVGWGSPRDYSTYVWAPKPQSTSLNGTRAQTVSFQGYQLPGDDKEFYQFCYVTKQGCVRGASTPFQFRMSNENDYMVEMEDESGMIILRTKSDALEEQLSTLTKEKSSLEGNIDSLTKQKAELTEKVDAIEVEVASIQENLKSSQDKNSELESEIEKLNKDLDEHKSRIEDANNEIAKTKSSLEAAEKTIENMKKQVEELEEQKQTIVDAKADDDGKYMKDLNEKEIKLQEYERDKVTLLDQIKTLTLVKDEAQKQSVTALAAHEKAANSTLKAKEEIAARLQYCKDERDLFKAQLTESELNRQEALQQLERLTEKLGEVENNVKAAESRLKEKSDELDSINEKLFALEKKYKHESAKNKELLRNALERASGLKTAKQLLSKELSETTSTRDKLMKDLTTAKKEKEVVAGDLQANQAIIGSLQSQLEIVEEKLEKSELMLLDHEQNVMKERRRAEEMERDMMEKVVVLQHQLQESDSAVAAAASEASLVVTKSRRTQTGSTSEGKGDEKTTGGEKVAIDDLKSQVTDLTTRLNMGADAYKDKFMECHKLERKLKKMKQLLQMKSYPRPSSPSSAATTGSQTSTPEDAPKGWAGAFEKFLTAITDPDAEEKEQAKQVQQKIESLQKNHDTEQGKHRKYKQLYNDEKQKSKSMKEREEEVTKALNDAEQKNLALEDENKMLRDQLNEFMEQPDNEHLKQMLTFPPESNSEDATSSSQELTDERGDEDAQYQDARGHPIRGKASRKFVSNRSDLSSSDASDGGMYPDGNGSFRKFNICADRSEESARVDTLPSSPRDKVISRQPIRSPPLIPDVITKFSSASTSRSSVTSRSGETRRRKPPTQSKRKSKKKTQTV